MHDFVRKLLPENVSAIIEATSAFCLKHRYEIEVLVSTRRRPSSNPSRLNAATVYVRVEMTYHDRKIRS